MTKQTKVILGIGFLLLSFGCLGCGGGILAILHYSVDMPIFEESKKTTIDKYKPQYETKRKQLKDMAKGLENKGYLPDQARTIDPPPVYMQKGDLSTRNCDVIMEEIAADPDKRTAPLNEEANLVGYDPEDLARHLAWTGTNSPMAPVVLGKRSDGLGKTLQTSLDRKYVIVFRAPYYQEAGGKGARMGTAEVVGHLFAADSNVPMFVWKVQVTELLAPNDFTGGWKRQTLPKLKMRLGEDFRKLTGGRLELD